MITTVVNTNVIKNETNKIQKFNIFKMNALDALERYCMVRKWWVDCNYFSGFGMRIFL